MKKLRIGLIGAGKIGLAQIEAIKAIEASGYVQLAAIATRDESKGQKICSEYQIPSHFTDYRAMLSGCDIDVVHNCTPNFLHYEINRDCIEAGCHVLSEKPLTVNSAQSADLVERAQTRKIKTAINYVYRYYSVIPRIRALIADGGLGRVYAVFGTFLQDWLLSENDYDWRIESQFAGPSRAFADIGSHWIDMVQYLLGQHVASIVADFATFIPNRRGKSVDTEDFASALLRFEGGAHGSLTLSQVSAGGKSGISFEIDGSKASLRWSKENPGIAIIERRGEPSQMLNGQGIISNIGQGAVIAADIPIETITSAQRSMIDNFYRSILFGEAPLYANFEEGHINVRIVEAAIRSNQIGGWVHV